MSTTVTNITAASRHNSSLAAGLREFFTTIRAAFECRNLMESLQRKSDSQLADMGLKRVDIPAHAYRRAFRT